MQKNTQGVSSATFNTRFLNKKRVVQAVLVGSLVSGVWIVATVPVSSQAIGPILAGSSPETTKILFVGDVMLDRSIRSAINRNGSTYVFGGVAPLLHSVDFVVGNLEGPITNNDSTSFGSEIGAPDNYVFTFPTTTPELLASYGFGLVSIGNNHIFDFGKEGVTETTTYLSDGGLSFVGDPLAVTPPVVVKNSNGIRIAFLAYNDFVGQDLAALTDAIRVTRASGVDVVVVLAHWGVEYVPEPPARVRTIAEQLAKAGADIVIGTHPHVIEPFEDIQNGSRTTRVYYSLGNFIFDQWFSPQVQCGLTVEATFTKSTTVHIAYKTTRVGLRKGGATVVGCN